MPRAGYPNHCYVGGISVFFIHTRHRRVWHTFLPHRLHFSYCPIYWVVKTRTKIRFSASNELRVNTEEGQTIIFISSRNNGLQVPLFCPICFGREDWESTLASGSSTSSGSAWFPHSLRGLVVLHPFSLPGGESFSADSASSISGPFTTV